MVSLLQIIATYECPSSNVTHDLYALAIELDLHIQVYSGCVVNGVRYHTKARDERHTTQNSGVCVEPECDGETSDFFGLVDEIQELSYLYWNKVIIFKFSWFDTNNTAGKKDNHFTSIKTDSLWYENEPYVLGDQVKQVFYVEDNKAGGSQKIIQKVNHRHIWENVSKVQEVDIDTVHEDDNNDAYQELLSNEVDITFDSTSVEAPLNRTDIGPIQIDALYIDLTIDPNDEVRYESYLEESNEETDVESDEGTDVESDEETDVESNDNECDNSSDC